MHKCIYKESVELISVYLSEGCGKTLVEINDTIPHTRIDMGYYDAKKHHTTIIYTKVSVVPYVLIVRKLPHFH